MQKQYPLLLLFMLFLIAETPLSAQTKIIRGIAQDSHSEERVPFASVSFKNTTIGKLTDSSGTFTFYLNEWPSDTLEITCVGYQPYRYIIDRKKDSIIVTFNMERGTFNDGASVKVKVNKGLLVWRKIVQNKPNNDRYRFKNFSYELYNKLELDLKNINFQKFGKFKPLKSISDLINQNIDTAEGLRYLPTYLTEALSDYYYQKSPKKRREIIKAANTNGVKNESVLKLLGGMDQVVNVYNNFIPVFDKQFVSPISDNGDYYYNYRVVDTQVINNQRFFHLVFTPRRQGGDTFEGDCWVHVGTFAIQRMNLRLGKEANMNFLENLSLIQEYKWLSDSIWFLSKDKFVADLSPVGKDRPGFIARKTTTYEQVIINDSSVIKELNKNKLLEEIITLPGAGEKPKEFWANARHEPLSKTESGIIKMIDTLTNAPVFQKFTRTMAFIGTGYKDIGNYQIGPWFNWVTSNGWEGFRVRFDLSTNKHFNKKFKFHTYLAYGFGDKKLKGMGEVFFLPNKSPRTYLYASFTNDLDFGQSQYGEVSSDNVFALAIRKKNIPIKNIKVNEKRFEFFNETLPWMSNLITVTHRTTLPLRNLLPVDSFPTNGAGKPFANFEVALRFRFAYLERFLESHFYRTSLGSGYPIGEINISHGFAGVLKSSYSYTKISASVSDYINVPPMGNISVLAYAGKTFGTVPYILLDIAPGNELYYYNKYSFNMMNRWEYIHDQYAGLNIEHNIGNGIFRLFPKLRFRQFWTAKTLWGSLTPANKALNFKQGHNFQSLDGNTYLELGTGIDNIFHVFRIDFVWRVLPSKVDRTNDKNFGIFGSFRVAF
ncbi:MAG: carboxypeptidase-like regulatory domain-containing protein [Chitinophagaceae bacterium]|nr:carboxypeptidase-like regulatory domain-containing protein [Chitinophagaceae bacterium]MBK7680886.1 carboxypeptidase-like regulatory domain-containing protein [Chitinophagaceae bacterium]MBK8300868.1 carboxypeptidase-like regulatory domain-containing protein [Chitinophagaceae bacterium]MBK9465300.1 carboxypeptidase-like regulatory domain-containing protein [Chitinophagaceae bacterium]MBL0069900.1 carboxypeptidase-like regulatory domain-containing protein [Chitinophagaceae bacterium]